MFSIITFLIKELLRGKKYFNRIKYKIKTERATRSQSLNNNEMQYGELLKA